MFLTGGLGSQSRNSLGGKLLRNACLKVDYKYLIATTLHQDSRAFQGADNLMNMLLSGGVQKIMEQHDKDIQILSEIGNVANWLSSCIHDDLPSSLPISETGFDKTYKLKVQEKPADTLDIVIEQDSVLRVSIHSKNHKN